RPPEISSNESAMIAVRGRAKAVPSDFARNPPRCPPPQAGERTLMYPPACGGGQGGGRLLDTPGCYCHLIRSVLAFRVCACCIAGRVSSGGWACNSLPSQSTPDLRCNCGQGRRGKQEREFGS